MKTSIKVALFVVFFIALACILGALYLYNEKHADMTTATPDYVISAVLLQKEFEDNETEASAKYINKILEVKGTIASIKSAENNMLNISLITGSDMSLVIGTFPSIADPSKFQVGAEITLRGECSGFLMDVLLNNCAVMN
jgi:hypothetical protein